MRVFGGKETKPFRTYHYGRGTVKDHRTGIVLPLRDVMNGKIQPFIDAARSKASREATQSTISHPTDSVL